MTNGNRERVRGWLGLLLPLLNQGGGVLSLCLLLIGGVEIWYLLGALDRAVLRNHALVEQWQGCMKQQVELALTRRERPP